MSRRFHLEYHLCGVTTTHPLECGHTRHQNKPAAMESSYPIIGLYATHQGPIFSEALMASQAGQVPPAPVESCGLTVLLKMANAINVKGVGTKE